MIPLLLQCPVQPNTGRKGPESRKASISTPGGASKKKSQSLVPSILVLLKNSSIGGRAGRGTHPLGPPACLLGNSARHLALGAILAHPGVSGHPPPPSWAHSTNSGTNHNSETYHCHTLCTLTKPSPCPIQGTSSSSTLPSAEGDMDRGEGQQRLSWPGGVVLHSRGAGQGKAGNGHSERQPQDPSYHKVPPRLETVPTDSLPLLHMCTYKHTHALIHIHMEMHTHTHTCSHTCNT